MNQEEYSQAELALAESSKTYESPLNNDDNNDHRIQPIYDQEETKADATKVINSNEENNNNIQSVNNSTSPHSSIQAHDSQGHGLGPVPLSQVSPQNPHRMNSNNDNNNNTTPKQKAQRRRSSAASVNIYIPEEPKAEKPKIKPTSYIAPGSSNVLFRNDAPVTFMSMITDSRFISWTRSEMLLLIIHIGIHIREEENFSKLDFIDFCDQLFLNKNLPKKRPEITTADYNKMENGNTLNIIHYTIFILYMHATHAIDNIIYTYANYASVIHTYIIYYTIPSLLYTICI